MYTAGNAQSRQELKNCWLDLITNVSTKKNMSGLLTLVPTRNRLKNALELLDVWYDTTTDKDSGLLFIVGWDDPQFHDYQNKIPEEHLLNFPDRGLVKALNYAAPIYWDDYEALGFMGDDHRPRTSGWDSAYLDELRKLGYGYVYGNDLHSEYGEHRVPTQVAISSSIVKCLGFFGPPGFRHLFVDTTWGDMGRGLSRISYLPEVIIEHMHYTNNKAEEDDTYRLGNSPENFAHDKAEYERWKREDMGTQLHMVALAHGVC